MPAHGIAVAQNKRTMAPAANNKVAATNSQVH
jgi:hypothetical protein